MAERCSCKNCLETEAIGHLYAWPDVEMFREYFRSGGIFAAQLDSLAQEKDPRSLPEKLFFRDTRSRIPIPARYSRSADRVWLTDSREHACIKGQFAALDNGLYPHRLGFTESLEGYFCLVVADKISALRRGLIQEGAGLGGEAQHLRYREYYGPDLIPWSEVELIIAAPQAMAKIERDFIEIYPPDLTWIGFDPKKRLLRSIEDIDLQVRECFAQALTH